MARLARVVVPGIPHHVTQRGNRRSPVFWSDEDYQAYFDLLFAAIKNSGTEVWAYCFMPNHVHMILVPEDEDGLRATFADAHRQYTRRINARNKWTGHLWQGRFGSVAMDEEHLANAIIYVSLNPVRAGLVDKAEHWKWSSVQGQLGLKEDALLSRAPVDIRLPDFPQRLRSGDDVALSDRLRKSETTGRPVGAKKWLQEMEVKTGRQLQAQKPGPKIQAKSMRIK